MDTRQERGMELAATKTILRKEGNTWLVPSQSGDGVYTVNIGTDPETCTCADFQSGPVVCKHIHAAKIAKLQEATLNQLSQDPSVGKKEKSTGKKGKTSPRNWPLYHLSQTKEGFHFPKLLRQLCSEVPVPAQSHEGRPPLPLSEVVFCCASKVYSLMGARRSMNHIELAKEKGLIQKTPHHNAIINYMGDPALTPVLIALIEQSSRPLRTIDDAFAADSTGFTVRMFTRWYDHKYGKVRQEHDWVKCHIMCGVKTHVVTAVAIGQRDAHDAPFLPSLVESTARNFKISEISADKAYGSRRNVEVIEAFGGTPFIQPKSTATGGAGGGWERMVDYFKYRKNEFFAHYNKRSNIESTFSVIKRLFGAALRHRTETAMVNETLCKLLCHNIVVLIREMYALGIDPTDWGTYPAPKTGPEQDVHPLWPWTPMSDGSGPK